MIKTLEAVIDANGNIKTVGNVRLPSGRRAFVTVLDERSSLIPETAMLSENSLAADWNRPEEDEAWAEFQSDR